MKDAAKKDPKTCEHLSIGYYGFTKPGGKCDHCGKEFETTPKWVTERALFCTETPSKLVH